MNALQVQLMDFQYPSSEELKKLAQLDSTFSKKTRHVRTSNNTFHSNCTPMSQSTWAFTSIEKNLPSVKQACDFIAGNIGKRVQCNAYFTPQGAQGLPIHYDLHDVIVLQIEGSKDWKIWPAFRSKVSIETLLLDEKENLPVWTSSIHPKELHLSNKQSLYLSRGEPHVAIATSEDSLHLSFGVYHD
ncbi:JmjC domain-containing protein [Bdellovibrio bacteriovorus]|uniref:JmjC domain-containing protein n=1 Tax=Bdellovibrio TaxID=958 RepID=UPI0035A85BF2